ncbi:MAG: TatD family hydrolase [Spirochaetales bacterium]|nr:TatD family hydrolase [Candidatus Physcosoma equi]
MVSRGLSPALPSSFLGLEIAIRGGDMAERLALRGERRDVYLSAGAGPWVLDEEDFVSVEDEIARVQKDIDLYGADAIGECGFDRHWGYGTMEQQHQLFVAEAELAKKMDVPLVIHTRESDEDLLSELNELGERVIMHCFASNRSVMEKLLDRGAYISFAGNVTYKANTLIQESAKYCPLDRILFETDAPYLSPVPMRREPNRPEYTVYTLAFLAELKGVEKETLMEHAVENFLSLMKNRESVVGL